MTPMPHRNRGGRRLGAFAVVTALFATGWMARAAQNAPATGAWTFLVSGDARNCGDIVMPAIAETARKNNAAFYWHLGDFRRTYGADEDILNRPENIGKPPTIDEYHAMEWPDFIENQIRPFDPIPFLVGIGNHEVIYPKTRFEFLVTFGTWLDTPMLRAQRIIDSPDDPSVRTYFHWIDRGIAFYYLDNASNDEFNDVQLAWFDRVLARDVANPAIVTFVVGMHKTLPDGYNYDHSMNESPKSTDTGRRVYASLLAARGSGKRVYVLASHQHFYMEDVYGSQYLREHGGVLDGWVIGTAGATRYSLPTPSPRVAMTNVYGSLLAKVAANGEIKFEFQRLGERDVPDAVVRRHGSDLVRWCFESNTLVPPQ
jgi:hypothetical protein